MGGGTVFRGVSRLVGAAAMGAAVVPTSEALCHAHPSASHSSREQESLLAILDDAQKEFCGVNVIDKDCGSFVNVRFEQEERPSENGEPSRGAAFRQILFYPPPTEEEVEDATKELHAVLNLSIPAQGFAAEVNLSASMVGTTDDMDIAPQSVNKRELTSLSSSSHPLNQFGNFPMENSSVMQAFQLLQSNPKVQDVVKSLARDPAVWNAMLSNEKMLELTREEDSLESEDSFDYDDDDDFFEMTELSTRVASKCYALVTKTKVYYRYVRGKLFSILNTMFGSMEKTLLTKGGASTKDKTVTSCMMLAVAVVIVVIVRRSLKRQNS